MHVDNCGYRLSFRPGPTLAGKLQKLCDKHNRKKANTKELSPDLAAKMAVMWALDQGWRP